MWKAEEERFVGIKMSQVILERLERLTYNFKINNIIRILNIKILKM